MAESVRKELYELPWPHECCGEGLSRYGKTAVSLDRAVASPQCVLKECGRAFVEMDVQAVLNFVFISQI